MWQRSKNKNIYNDTLPKDLQRNENCKFPLHTEAKTSISKNWIFKKNVIISEENELKKWGEDGDRHGEISMCFKMLKLWLITIN